MSYETADKAIIADFDTKWSNYTAISWPNVEFDVKKYVEFIDFEIKRAIDTQISTGNVKNDWRKFGVLIIKVCTKLEGGAQRSAELVDLVTDIYRGLQLSPDSITFGEIDVVTVGRNDGFYQENVEVEFYRNEQH